MIRATVDTNAIASGFLRGDTPPGRILAAWRARLFILVISAFILDELDRTFATPYFTRHLSSEQRAANVILLRDQAVITPITVTVSGVATHSEDDLVLATAISGQADYLVTGDGRFRTRVPEHQSIRLLSPTEFVQVLERETL